ncbi:hypothetical protein MC885_016951 [Smutsia gigantea]|nr:hypothetical protein MC885_016951 [Smutsia gigantea]
MFLVSTTKTDASFGTISPGSGAGQKILSFQFPYRALMSTWPGELTSSACRASHCPLGSPPTLGDALCGSVVCSRQEKPRLCSGREGGSVTLHRLRPSHV